MTAILVTGGAGFIGSNFVHHWHRAHPQDKVVVLDALTYAGNPENITALLKPGGVELVHGDICDTALLAGLFASHDFAQVVHFAAESHVDRSIVAPDAFIRTNVGGTLALLQAALAAFRKTGTLTRFHHVSTDEVYGSLEPDDPAFTEATPYAPRSPYAASKAASDHLVNAYGHTYGLPITISNCSNNYGPYHFPEKLIPLMIVNLLEGRPLPVYGDGRNVRDWLYVEDHCAAIAAILERGRTGETYNVGGNSEVDNIDLVHSLCDIFDARFAADPVTRARFPNSPAARGSKSRDLITFVKDRPGHDRRYAVNAGKIAAELGVYPTVGLKEGLARMIDWYLANEDWWRRVMTGDYQNWIASHYGAPADNVR
jgi:dTDP-glucose 4,6-dehydratase